VSRRLGEAQTLWRQLEEQERQAFSSAEAASWQALGEIATRLHKLGITGNTRPGDALEKAAHGTQQLFVKQVNQLRPYLEQGKRTEQKKTIPMAEEMARLLRQMQGWLEQSQQMPGRPDPQIEAWFEDMKRDWKQLTGKDWQ
jgi:hypothetical protein